MHAFKFLGLAALGCVTALAMADTAAANHRSKKDRARAERAYKGGHLTADQREYERTLAEGVDPGGSYAAYPDWARYALSPKGGNR